MKKNKVIIFFSLFILIPFIYSCKKGEHDPIFSIHSRKNRICGEWEMTAGKLMIVDKIRTVTVLYDNGTFIEEQGTSYKSGTYTDTYKITSDGKYIHNCTYKYDINGELSEYADEGIWYFLARNKEEELKNKEAVAFQLKVRNFTYKGVTETFNMKGEPPLIFRISQLKKKEIAMERYYSYNSKQENNIISEDYILTAP